MVKDHCSRDIVGDIYIYIYIYIYISLVPPTSWNRVHSALLSPLVPYSLLGNKPDISASRIPHCRHLHPVFSMRGVHLDRVAIGFREIIHLSPIVDNRGVFASRVWCVSSTPVVRLHARNRAFLRLSCLLSGKVSSFSSCAVSPWSCLILHDL